MSDLISRQAAIDTDGLDEEIRCEMCKNPMHTDRGCDGNCKYDEKLYERIMQILDERIKPLPSAQPYLQPTCNQLATDTISRQAAIDAIGEKPFARTGGEYEQGLQNQWQRDTDRIKILPSAQPERKTGKWIYDGDCYICDQCKSAFGWWADSQTSNYCPNCGADMRGIKNE